MIRLALSPNILVVGLLLGAVDCGPTRKDVTVNADSTPSPQSISQGAPTGLGGTSWRLVKFQGGDGLTLTPDDKAKYTIHSEPMAV
jgi:hypothetical protein